MIRPILFNQFSAKANMAGIKTQTRRERGLKEINKNPDDWTISVANDHLKGIEYGFFKSKGRAKTYTSIKCPYGNIGDVLWVCETWAKEVELFENVERQTIYRADNHVADASLVWKPSIHMPKDAARQWLRITDIRVERLFSISEEDALAEGIGRWIETKVTGQPTRYQVYTEVGINIPDMYSPCPKESYYSLLGEMHGRMWVDTNPWLWVIEYEVLSTTGKPETVIARNEAISDQ